MRNIVLFAITVAIPLFSDAYPPHCPVQLASIANYKNAAIPPCPSPSSTIYTHHYNTVWMADGSMWVYAIRHTCGTNVYYDQHLIGQVSANCFTGELVSYKPMNNIEDSVNQCGSIVQVENRVVGEIVPVVGAPFSLTYFTNRVIGRLADYRGSSVVSGTTLRPNVTGYSVDVTDDTGANVHNQTFSAAANHTYTFLWDGLDTSSAETWGRRVFTFKITEQATDVELDTSTKLNLGSFKAKKLGLGAWVPSIWHFYDINSSRIFRGTGANRWVAATPISGGNLRVAEDDASQVYIFDSAGKHLETRLGITGEVIYSFAYDGSGRLSTVTQPFSKVTTFTRDGSGNLTSITAPNGKVTNVTLDGNGYLATITSPKSEVYEMTYYGVGGLINTFEKPNGAYSTFTYDGDGNLVKDEDSLGSWIALAENILAPNNSVVTSTSKMGRVRTVKTYYNSSGQQVQEELPPYGSTKTRLTSANIETVKANTTTMYQEYWGNDLRFGDQAKRIYETREYKYGTRTTQTTQSLTLNTPSDPFSINTWQIKATTSAAEVTSTYTGSTKTNVVSSKLGRTQTTQYDQYQRPIQTVRGGHTPVDFTYTNDQLTKIEQGARETEFRYNSTSGLLEEVENALGQVTSFVYDSAERLTSQTLPDSRVINYTFDFNGNMTSISTPKSNTHTFNFDASGRNTSYVAPTLVGVPSSTTTYTYNLDNQLSTIVNPAGQTITINYYATDYDISSIVTPATTYTFNYYNTTKHGYLSKISSPLGFETNFDYTSKTRNKIGLKISGTQAFTYTLTPSTTYGRTQSDSLTVGGSTASINYTYDNDELLTGAGDVTLAYDIPNGDLTGTTMGAVTDTYTYNAFGEVTGYDAKYSGSTIYSYTLTRDLLGRITSKTENINGTTKTIDYDYDSSGRLIEADHVTDAVTNTYGYDNNSNRNSGSINGQTTTATYDDQDRMTQFNVYDYVYDDNGVISTRTNTATSAVDTFTYDIFGNLTQLVMPAKTVSYEVDPANRRVGRKVNGTLIRRYAHDLKNRIIAEINPAGTIYRRYVYGSKPHMPDYFVEGANKYRIISDLLGSPRVIVKVSDGTIMQTMEHDEFGRVMADSNPGYTPFGFAGGHYDHETGFVRFGARDFDTQIGRWTSKDPILFAGKDTNLFGYVANDPVNLIDPSGLKPGDKFSNPADAAKDALDFIWDQSQKSGWEYSGGIYQNKDGTYSATVPTTLKNPFSSQFKWGKGGSYHTHPMVCDDRGVSLEPDSFSSSDIRLGDTNNITVFMMGPNRTLNTYRGK